VSSFVAGILSLACSAALAEPRSSDVSDQSPAAVSAPASKEASKSNPAATSDKSATSTQTHSTPKALTPEECLVRVKTMEPMLPTLLDSAKMVITRLIPDPQDFEKKLPPFEKVIADKDVKNLKNYGGLAEAYLYGGDEKSGDKLFAQFKSGRSMLPADDTFPGGVYGDFGFMYFAQKKYSEAEPLLLESMRLYETYPTAYTNNGLVTDYLCLSLIKDQAGDKTAAGDYAKKLIDLALKEHQRTPD
jgi:hypothetical protein